MKNRLAIQSRRVDKAISKELKTWEKLFEVNPYNRDWQSGFECGVHQALYFLERRIQQEA